MRVLAHADHEWLSGLLCLRLQEGETFQEIPRIIVVLRLIIVAEQDVCLWCNTAEGPSGRTLDVTHDAACRNADAMRSVGTVGIFHLQRVEQFLGLVVGRTRERVLRAVSVGDDDLLSAEGRVVWHVIAFDAQVAVLVLEHRMAQVEAGVYDAHDDALARIGLWQLWSRAVVHLVGLRHLARHVGLLRHLRGHIDDSHALHFSQSLQSGIGDVEHNQSAFHHSHAGTDLSCGVGHLSGVGILVACHEKLHTGILVKSLATCARPVYCLFILFLGNLNSWADESLRAGSQREGQQDGKK